MSEPDEEKLGQALGRAVDAQIARETRFESSRLAAQLERPARSPFSVIGGVAIATAALALLLGGGVLLVQLRSDRGTVASPTPSVEVVTPSPTPAVASLAGHAAVYCARADAPPFAIGMPGVGTGATAEERIESRLQALEGLRPLGPTEDGVCRVGFPSSARVTSVRVQADLALIDYEVSNDDWALVRTDPRGPYSIVAQMLVQEIVYTASEEPGIRRVLLTQNGGESAVIGGSAATYDRPLTREDVLGYRIRAATEQRSQEARRAAIATTRQAVDEVAPGLARFVIELAPKTPAEPRWIPEFSAELHSYDESKDQNGLRGKWTLEINIPRAEVAPPPGRIARERIVAVDRTPLRVVHEVPTFVDPANRDGGMRYVLYLDDSRPWRIGWLADPVRIIVDVGGPHAAVTQNLAVYRADVTGGSVTVSGMARAFEANVQWRVRDASGASVASGHTTASLGTSETWGLFGTTITLPLGASGNFTLEVFLSSAQDGSIRELVAIPLAVR